MRIPLVLVLGLCLVGAVFAQSTNSGDIRGTVTDQTGAVVPGVQVKLTNLNTGVVSEYVTNGAGLYDTVSILPGKYQVTFSKEGFNKVVHDNVELSVGILTIDAQLSVGTAVQQVEITAEAALLKTETGEQSSTLKADIMSQLPNVGQDWQNFIKLLPGASGAAGANNALSVNGNLPNYANYLADGGSVTLPHSGNFDSSIFETIAEVQVSTSSFSAQYGIGGLVFNQISKGGTNQYHGAAYEYIQNDAFNARSFFAQRVNFRRFHNFGGSVGGPVIKNRMFFYFNLDKIISKSQSSPINTYPTVAAKGGDFSDSAYRNVIYDPLTLTTAGGVTARTPFGGNRIPSSRIDPVSAKLQAYWPTPTLPGVVNNWQGNVPGASPFLKYFGRLDYNVTSANRLTFSITERDNIQSTYQPNCPINCYTGDIGSWNVQLSDVWSLGTRVVNEFRMAFSRQGNWYTADTLGKDYPTQLGIAYAKANLFPDLSVGGPVGGASFSAGVNAIYAQSSFQPSDVVTLIQGRHILHFGGELLAFRDNSTPWGNMQAASLTFSGVFTRKAPFDGNSGLGYADFLLGNVSAWGATNTPITGARQKSPQMFIQDDFKVRQNLTLNLGLRYQLQTGWHEIYNRLGSFDPTLTNPVTQTPGAMWFGGDNGRTALEKTVNVWLPRVGVAWTPKSDWTVRGGFGIYSYPWSIDTYSRGALGFGTNSTGSMSNTDQVNPLFKVSDSNPALNYIGASKAPGGYNGRGVSYAPYETPVAKNYQWSLSIQRQMRTIVLETAYIGSHGVNLSFPVDINQVPESKLATGDAQSRRPFPQYLGISADNFNAISNYNAFQFSAKKRFSHGLSFDTNYTFSKMMSSMDSAGWGSRSGSQTYQRANAPMSGYSRSNFDIPHAVKASVVYALPFGKGYKWLNSNALVDAVLGGWQFSSIMMAQSGNLFTPTMSVNLTNALAGTQFPNVVGNPYSNNWSGDPKDLYFNTAAFTSPGSFVFGNAGRNILRGPGLSQVDFSMGKTLRFPHWEAAALQLRFDATNAPNHASFGNPNASIGGASAGKITSTTVSGRTLQLGARLSF